MIIFIIEKIPLKNTQLKENIQIKYIIVSPVFCEKNVLIVNTKKNVYKGLNNFSIKLYSELD